jgi:hypothetical protein
VPIKIKTDLRTLQKFTDGVRKKFNQEISKGESGRTLIDEIVRLIRKGVSPVNKEGRFKRYSQSYRDAIDGKVRFWTSKTGQVIAAKPPRRERFELGFGEGKKKSPVSMTRSGKMLRSLTARLSGKSVFLVFDDKKAVYHDMGTEKMPARRLLPRDGERFTDRLTQVVVRALRKAVRRKN